MLRLVRYLKPYTVLILIAIILLFIQAMADLSLPDYMSRIVNVGIQQGGIENAVPEAIRQSELDKLAIFMTDEEKELVLRSYTLTDKNSPDYEKYLDVYPQLEKEAIYIINDIDRDEKNEINPVMGRALLAVSGIEQILQDPSKTAAAVEEFGFDLSKIPDGIQTGQLFEMFKKLPEGELLKIQNSINERFEIMGESMVNQSAVIAVKAEYDALGINAGRIQNNYIWHTGLIMMLISLLSAASTVTVGYLSARTAAGLSKDLRKKIFDKVESFSNAEFDKFSTASLITRSTNDITQIQMLVIIIIRVICYAPIMGIGGIIRALGESKSMSWIIAVVIIVIISLILVVFSITLPKFKKIQGLVDRLNLVTRESLSGMMVIRAFNKQNIEEERFDRANDDLTRTSLFVNRAMVTMMPFIMLLMNGVSILIIWVGAHQVSQSNMQVGDMMAFLQYAMLIIMSFLMLSIMFIMIPRASVSAGRVVDVLETGVSIHDPENPKKFDKSMRGIIEFRDVSFRYPEAEEDMLHDISFTAKPGQTTAIIGSTGSGKSTITNLLLRFYDISRGQILVDGMDIRDVTQFDLRSRIGYIPQKSILFSGTIESNLKYGDEKADIERLREAAKTAQALDFISEKPEGFNAEISQAGKNISGGQSQRLSIARALVKNPEILILDDCFSALDFKTDKALRRALKKYSSDSTILIVAQRVGTVMNAEQIIVIDEGRIAGKGTHNELMKNCQSYREIALSQLSVEELE